MKSMLKSLMSVAAAALALTSCSTDATEDVILKGEPKTLEVNATIEQTRTTLAADHIDLNWSAGDQIKLYIGASATKDKVITHNTTGSGSGTIQKVAYEDKDKVYAYYTSYTHEDKSTGVTATNIEIPKAQEQTEAGVFAGVNLPMVAQGEISGNQVTLNFKPAGCVLVFNVYGPTTNEKIKSIKFESSEPCSGYTNNDLTQDPFVYTPHKSSRSATVELGTATSIGASKPNNTQTAENQIYLVVAQVNYPSATFTVTTEAGKTYTFVTPNGIDCSKNTARVVNLNLAKSPEGKPAIEVPTVDQLESVAGEHLIEGIKFRHFAADAVTKATAAVYNDEALTEPLENSWLTITENGVLADGVLNYSVTENTGAERTAYIGIECAGVKAAIAISQAAQGTAPVVVVPDPITADLPSFVGNDYEVHSNDTWTVTFGGGNGSLGSNSKSASNRSFADYPAIAQALGLDSSTSKAVAVISKIALPAGYNTATLEYSRVRAKTQIGIAFSTDGTNWTKIMDWTELAITSSTGSQTYSFDKQGAGYYAFVANADANDSRIQTCKITYSQQ